MGGQLVLIIKKSYMGFRLIQKSVILNGVHMAVILRYFTEYGSFRGPLCKSGWRACREMS